MALESVEYPDKMSSIDCTGYVGFTPAVNGGILALRKDRYYQGLEVFQALDEPMTVDELVADLGLELEAIRDRLTYLEKFDRVRQNGDTFCPVE